MVKNITTETWSGLKDKFNVKTRRQVLNRMKGKCVVLASWDGLMRVQWL
jgi:hypothetical protein